VTSLVILIVALLVTTATAIPSYSTWPNQGFPPPSKESLDPKFVQTVGGWPGSFTFAAARVGERANEVRAALGAPEKVSYTHSCDSWFEYWTYELDHQRAQLTVEIIKGGLVSTLTLKPMGTGTSGIKDRYGIGLGDTAEHVREVRGKPHGDDGQDYVFYLVARSVSETYHFTNDRVSAITVDWETLP